MFEYLKKKAYGLWDGLRKWFKDSEVIVWSRLQVLAGLVVAGVGAVDWTAVFNMAADKAITDVHTLYLAGGLFLNGIFTEVLRRSRATDLNQ